MQKGIHFNDKSCVIYLGIFSLFWLPYNKNKLTKKLVIFSIQTNRAHHLDLISRIFSHGNFLPMSWTVCLSNNRRIRQNRNDCCRHMIVITSKSSNLYFSSYSSKYLTNSTTYKHYDDCFGGCRHWAAQTNFGVRDNDSETLCCDAACKQFCRRQNRACECDREQSELIKPT